MIQEVRGSGGSGFRKDWRLTNWFSPDGPEISVTRVKVAFI